MEIKFKDDQAYLLKSHNISTAEIEEQLRGFNYSSLYTDQRKGKDNLLEEAPLPLIITAFYAFVFLRCRIPSPEEMIDYYFRFYAKDFQMFPATVGFRDYQFRIETFEGRLLRAYPSLVRDFHFFRKLTEAHCFDSVTYSTKDDFEGSDIVIVHRGKKYAVCLMVSTERSRTYKDIKNAERHVYGDNEIRLFLDMKNARTVGDFYLYGDEHIQELKDLIYHG